MLYEVIVSKTEQPIRMYLKTENEAREKAIQFAKKGYYVSIWQIDKKGAKEIAEYERISGKEKLPWWTEEE